MGRCYHLDLTQSPIQIHLITRPHRCLPIDLQPHHYLYQPHYRLCQAQPLQPLLSGPRLGHH